MVARSIYGWFVHGNDNAAAGPAAREVRTAIENEQKHRVRVVLDQFPGNDVA
jgi:hypothetical protein